MPAFDQALLRLEDALGLELVLPHTHGVRINEACLAREGGEAGGLEVLVTLRADGSLVIDNDGDLEALERSASAVWQALLARA